MPSDGRQGPDYRSNLHVPGMDSVPDTEVFECPEQTADKSFSTFGKETPLRQQHLHPHQNHHHLLKSPHLRRHQGSIERKELETFLPSTRAPYKPAFLSEYCVGSTCPALWSAAPIWRKRQTFCNWLTKKHVCILRSDSHIWQSSFQSVLLTLPSFLTSPLSLGLMIRHTRTQSVYNHSWTIGCSCVGVDVSGHAPCHYR